MKVLLVGSQGWIGGLLKDLLIKQGHQVVESTFRMEEREAVARQLDMERPDRVVCAAGVTGRPNVDWCETHRAETQRANVLGVGTLADECDRRGMHLTVMASGCIYSYDAEHPVGGRGFVEADPPNYRGSFYSETKILAEALLREYPRTLILRLRLPISADLHPRSLLTKLLQYERVVNIPNSVSVLPDLLPVAVDMMAAGHTGVFNFTNPGVVSHNELLAAYRDACAPELTWTNMSLEEQARILRAGRSNNCLDVSKLLSLYPSIPPIHESLSSLFSHGK